MSKELKLLGPLLALRLLAGSTAFSAEYTAATWISSSVPPGINYQGRVEEQGAVINGQRQMRFRVYDALTGGTLRWDSGLRTLEVKNGVFGTMLDIPYSALRGAGQKYLEVEIEFQALTPREPLRSVPYARVAETVEGTLDIREGGLTVRTPVGDALFASSATGNMGFGTQAANARLTVSSSVSAGSAPGLELINPNADSGLRLGFNFQSNNSPGTHAAVDAVQTAGDDTRLALFTRIGPTLTERIRITPAGNVGMGTVNPIARLHVLGSVKPMAIVSHASQPQAMLRIGSANRVLMGYEPSVSRLGTQNSSDLVLAPNEVERMRLAYNVSVATVGIGTTDPQRALDVAGGGLRATKLETLHQGSAAAPALTFGAGNDVDTGLFTPAADHLAAATGGSERLRVVSAGGLGIGTTDPGGMALKVMAGDVMLGNYPGTASTDPDLFIEGDIQVDGSIYQTGGTSSHTAVAVSTTVILTQLFKVGAGSLTVLSEGRVGIGTTDPAYPLHVSVSTIVLSHATMPAMRLKAASTDVWYSSYSAGVAVLGSLGVNPFHLGVPGFSVLQVGAGGGMGVNRDPVQTLHVNGDMHANSMELTSTLPVASGGTASASTEAARVALGGVATDGTGTIWPTAAKWPIYVSGTAPAAQRLDRNGSNCAAGVNFPRGFDDYLRAEDCQDATGGLLQNEATNEGFIYDNDNILSGAWALADTNRSLDLDVTSHTFFVNGLFSRVGVGMIPPTYKLEVDGDLGVTGKVKEGGGDIIPAGAITFANLTACPDGWTELTTARGRYIVGLNGGSPGAPVGTELSDGEDRLLGLHSHTYNGAVVANHDHHSGAQLSCSLAGHGHATWTSTLDIPDHDHDPLSCSVTGTHTFSPDAIGNHGHPVGSTHNHDFSAADDILGGGGSSYVGAQNQGAVRSVGATTGFWMSGGGAHTEGGGIGNNLSAVGAPSCTTVNNGAHNDAGTVANYPFGSPACSTAADPQGAHTDTITINNAGTGTSTNAPYIQLLVCQKI